MTKFSVDQHIQKAKSQAKKGNYFEAQNLYEIILKSYPNNRRAQQGLASLVGSQQTHLNDSLPPDKIKFVMSLYNKGEFHEVISQLLRLVEKYSSSLPLWNLLGASYLGLKNYEMATTAFEKATQLSPKQPEGYNNLGVSLKNEGKKVEAINAFQKALALNPSYADAYYNLGTVLQEQMKLSEASSAYSEAVSIKPNHFNAYNNMGVVLSKLGKQEEALAAFNEAQKIQPENAEVYFNMAIAFESLRKIQEALNAYFEAIRLRPNYFNAYNNVGNTFLKNGREEEALVAFNKAQKIQPENAEVHFNIGVALESVSRISEGLDAYKTAIFFDPNYAEAHRNLSTLIDYKSDNPHINQVKQLLLQTNLTNEDKCHLHYAAAKIYDDLGDIKAAYENYVAGGLIRKKLLGYQPQEDIILFNGVINQAKNIKNIQRPNDDEILEHNPIFIVGMPRSGTSLVEQIISNHSQVTGAGELPFMRLFGYELNSGVSEVNSENILALRKAYLKEISNIADGKPLVTDKSPQNFLYISLILAAFPEAKIVHVTRDPAATCWSNFKHYFVANGLGYSYDLNDTTRYFRLYQKIMVFWDQLYKKKIYHLDYENLITNQTIEIKKLVKYLDLQWENNCLSPHKNPRRVRTASRQQIRNKIYKGSSEAWKKFKPYLDGVFDELYTERKK